MNIPVYKARQLARAYLQERGDIDMSLVSLHYLGFYKRRHAFEVRFNYPDGLLVDKGLPIVLIVSAKEVIYLQSEESLDIMYSFWNKEEERRRQQKKRRKLLAKDPQTIADMCARKCGYFCASLLGEYDQALAFSPRYKCAEALPEPEGLPLVILIEAGEARVVQGSESFEVLDKIRYRDYERGRAIFKEYERKVDENDFKTKKERDYITEIVEHRRPGYDVPVDEETLYDYLEIAERLGMKLRFKPNDVCSKRTDGWMYDIVLVKK